MKETETEIEVKFHVPDKDSVRRRILGLGAISSGEQFETNTRFDDENESLKKNKSLIRLRQDSQARLTFKSAPPVRDTEFKVVRELEVVVSSFETMKKILESLGYFPQQIYEKRRETFDLHDCAVCLDTMPYGVFLEIEGEREKIRQIADDLGFEWGKRILPNYLSVFAGLKEKLGFEFSEVTFENFESLAFEFSPYSQMFEAGDSVISEK